MYFSHYLYGVSFRDSYLLKGNFHVFIMIICSRGLKDIQSEGNCLEAIDTFEEIVWKSLSGFKL